MIFPIVAYGHPVLRKMAVEIHADYAGLAKFIDDMWETMYASSGVGLAAPQVGRAIRIFVADTQQLFNNMNEEERAEYPGDDGVREVFINAQISELDGAEWPYNEGCLSIPKIREDIYRQQTVTVNYMDASFIPQVKTFTGISARVVLHEYDHIEGKLFIDYISPLKRKLMKGKLNDISKGKVNVDYKMLFPG